jgi:hypothetical protein
MTKKTASTESTVSTESTESTEFSVASEFLFDPSLMSEEFNAVRIPRLPYGIVINDNPCGIFIPEKNAIKAGWTNLESLTEFEFASGAKEKGLFFSTVRMAILGNVPPYIRYKTSDELGDMGGVYVGSYEFDRDLLDKKTMEVVSEHLVMFLDNSNNLLHTRPLRIRFKNVALWCLREALEEFYTAIELVFAKLTLTNASGKNDKWRSLCVFCATFKPVKEGESSNKSWCMKVDNWLMPSIDNFPSMFLGVKVMKDTIWESYDMNVGSLSPKTKALPGSNQLLLRSAE